jgi:peroxiredoxin family protein
MVPLGDEGQVEACSVLSDIMLILTQDSCTDCVEHNIGLEIILDAPDGTPR